MNTLEAINSRRSIKHYQKDYQIPEQELEQLLSLAVLSPTAYNIQNWRFVVVKDKALREQLRVAAWDQAQITDASVLIVLCADLNAWKKQPERYWANAPVETQQFLLPMIEQYYQGKDSVQRDEAMRSCGMAAQTLMLSAKAMGYDSVPMDGFDFNKVAELINLPEDHVISMFVAIGKAEKPAFPRGGQLPLNQVVIENTFT
ncbi:nitroreductase family protein [Pseudocolwellia agarivorans]|uniref:nitroreductase family protein n=1 Tax=Pseudocolwellia agarivorans TaxID=1911682 RepID=UPI00098576D3|nr:nitroreductase family protein [Pseudocolwellia agarivorans]